MTKPTAISEVMTKAPHTIGLDQNSKLAQEMMRKHGIRHLPVQEGGRLVGVVTHRDIQFALALLKPENDVLELQDVYTPEPYVVEPATSIREVVMRMAEERLGCALIAEHQKVEGIFTTVDACRVLAQLLE